MSRNVVAEKEVVLHRTFNAPLDLVWTAWTRAEYVQQWWGPHMFSNPHCEWDATPGGKILIHMQGPDGNIFPMTGKFREVVPQEKLSYFSDVPDGEGGIYLEAEATVTFTSKGEQTEIVITAKGVGYQEVAKYMLAGMEEGWSQSQEKLAAYLATLTG